MRRDGKGGVSILVVTAQLHPFAVEFLPGADPQDGQDREAALGLQSEGLASSHSTFLRLGVEQKVLGSKDWRKRGSSPFFAGVSPKASCSLSCLGGALVVP